MSINVFFVFQFQHKRVDLNEFRKLSLGLDYILKLDKYEMKIIRF